MTRMLQIALATFLVTSHVTAEYSVGVGIADMTGPAAEINMVGRRPNGVLRLSLNDMTILLLMILLDKTVSVG